MSDPLSEDKSAEIKSPDVLVPESTPSEVKVTEAGGVASEIKASEGVPTETPVAEKKVSGVAKPVRRTGVVNARKISSAADLTAKPPAPPPDRAKSIALAVCGLLIVGIIGMGGYTLYKKFGPKPEVPVKLSKEAQDLKDLVTQAKVVYEEGKKLSKSEKLEDLREADKKLVEAQRMFDQIVANNKSFKGIEDQVSFAEKKQLSIDGDDLKPLRARIYDLEAQESRSKSMNAPSVNTPDIAPAVPTTPYTGPKEPTADELTDENLEKKFKNDPSEYERLAKKRKEKDPTYVIKKEE